MVSAAQRPLVCRLASALLAWSLFYRSACSLLGVECLFCGDVLFSLLPPGGCRVSSHFLVVFRSTVGCWDAHGYGCTCVSLPSYTIVVSTFKPGSVGPFKLIVGHSKAKPGLKSVQELGAGMSKQVRVMLQGHPAVPRVPAPSSPWVSLHERARVCFHCVALLLLLSV